MSGSMAHFWINYRHSSLLNLGVQGSSPRTGVFFFFFSSFFSLTFFLNLCYSTLNPVNWNFHFHLIYSSIIVKIIRTPAVLGINKSLIYFLLLHGYHNIYLLSERVRNGNTYQTNWRWQKSGHHSQTIYTGIWTKCSFDNKLNAVSIKLCKAARSKKDIL